jgi:peptidyl-prolyl cis-trans isomerase D
MATLEKIRNKAGLLIGEVGLALIAFILGDFLQSGSTFFHQSKEKVAVVDGHSIGIMEFQNEQERFINNYKNSTGESPSEAQSDQIRQMVFEQLVGKILINEKSKKIGFVVSKEELADMVIGNNISPIVQQYFRNPQTGMFDRNSLIQFLQQVESDDWSMYSPEDQRRLQSSREMWLGIEKNIAEQKLQEKFSSLLVSGLVVNSLDAKAAFDDNAVSVDFNFVTQSFNSIPDTDVEVSDAEVAKLYELRKNTFKQDHSKIINYIAVNILPSETDFTEISSQIEKLKDELADANNPMDLINENSDEPFLDAYVSTSELSNEAKSFVESASIGAIDGPVLTNRTYSVRKLIDVKRAPDSVKINQIAFPTYDEDRVKSMTDSLIKVIKSGKSFAEVAFEQTNGQSNGDIGWHTETSLIKNSGVIFPDLDVFFNAKVNDVFTVRSSHGIHLMKVVEKTKPVMKYKIGEIRKEVTPSTETYNKLYSDLNQYIVKNNTLELFKTAAQEAGYFCQMNIPLLENQNNIASIENTRQVIRWAFNSKKGDISEIFECQNRAYFVVAAVEGELKAGIRPLREVSDFLKRELINEKKGAKIIENLKAKNLTSLEEYAEAMNSTLQEVKFVTFSTPRITGIGLDPIVNSRAIASEVGRITGPFAGKMGVYVLSLTAKNTSNETYDEVVQKQQLNMQNSYRTMQLVQDNRILKEKATIEDNRSRFY